MTSSCSGTSTTTSASNGNGFMGSSINFNLGLNSIVATSGETTIIDP